MSDPHEATEAKRSVRKRITGHPLTHLLAALVLLGLLQGFVVKQFAVPSGSMQQTLEVGDRLLVNRLAYGPFGEAAPKPGDIVVFSADDELWPSGRARETRGVVRHLKHAVKFVFGDLIGIGPTTDRMLVKRVIATEGQSVECCGRDGGVVVDGVELDEPYIYENLPFEVGVLDCASDARSLRCFAPVTVPEGMLLVLGDHRSNSGDGITECRGVEQTSSESCARWVRVDDVVGEVFTVIWPLSRFGGIE